MEQSHPYELSGHRLGKYQVEELIARGGMALVYRGQDTVLNRPVAIKVLDPALAATEPGSEERFRREAITAANLEHPNIVPTYDVAATDGLLYIAMRYVPGETLRELLDREGRLSPARAYAILKPIAAALDYAHERGVIHRDVKPGNILIEPNGHVVLTDFGIARAAAQSTLTRTGKVMGTAEYLAPEQIQGLEVTQSADIYALGVVLYELLAGRSPFQGEHLAETLYKSVHEPPPPLRSFAPDLPRGLDAVVDRALEKNPVLRFASDADMMRALEPFTAESMAPQIGVAPSMPTVANDRPPILSPTARPAVSGARRPAGLDRRLLVPGAIVLLVLVFGGAFLLGNARRTDKPVTPTPGGLPAVNVTLAPEETSVAAIQTPNATAMPPTAVKGAPAAFAAPRGAAYSGPRRDGNAPDLYMGRANRPPTIDGDIGDWSGAQGFTPVKVILNPAAWKGPQDLSAEFRIGYDDANFYVSVVVTDDVQVQNNLTRRYDLWKGDDVELWFDFDLPGDFALDPGDGDDWQLGLSPGDFKGWPPQAVFFRPEQHTGSEKGVTVAAKPRGDSGYVLEAALPWPMPGWKPQPDGGAIGFCASVGDNDAPRTAQQQKMSSTCTRMKWNVPTTYGMLFY